MLVVRFLVLVAVGAEGAGDSGHARRLFGNDVSVNLEGKNMTGSRPVTRLQYSNHLNNTE